MPAVNPARLRSQIDRVLELFASPRLFHRHLQDLFSQYANRALRFGTEAQTQPLMLMFHLPDPLMRQLKLDLNPLIQTHPELSLELSDELWQSDYFEIRVVAIHILSRVPLLELEPILNRLERWLTPDLETSLASELLSKGAQRLAKSYSHRWEAFLETFLNHKNPKLIAFGVIGFYESLTPSEYSNLPVVFRKISPLIQKPRLELLTPLRDLLETLAGKFPEETQYFLRQSLALSDSPVMKRLVKQCLPFFEGDLQNQLKMALN